MRISAMAPTFPRTPGQRSRSPWTLLAWGEFENQYQRLNSLVRELKARDPVGYASHPQAKLLAVISKLIWDVIPGDPGSHSFILGNALGAKHRHWRRAKFSQRFRLFFRFHSERRIIVYAWMSDAATMRKEGARTDPYFIFRAMIERGSPPEDFDTLVRESQQFAPE
jgi:toxin YhaV